MLPGGAQTLVVEGDLGGGTVTFFTNYFGVSDIQILDTTGTPLEITEPQIYDLFYLAGGMKVYAVLSGSTDASVYVGLGV